MTTRTTNESATGDTAAPSGQTFGLNEREYSTAAPDSQLSTLQHRIGHIRLKARIPGACIALEIPGPVAAQLLTIDEARQLIGALASLIGDIEADLHARAWSEQTMHELLTRRPDLAQLYEEANGSAESYASKL